MPKYLRLKLEHILFIVFAAFVFLFHSNMGADYYWHLEAGEYLKGYGAIPTGDPFSFTFYEEPWVLHEWLFEIVLYHIYTFAGHYGVKLFVAATMSAALFTVYRASVAFTDNRSHSLIITTVTLLIFYKFSLPRPQIITYLFFAIYLHILLGYKYRTYQVKLYWLPIIMVLWVNIHAGYLIGIVLLLLFILTEAIERLFDTENKNVTPATLTPLLWTLALCLAASLLNPYSYNQWLYPFQVVTMSATDSITEWKSPDFHKLLFKGYLLYFIGFFFLRGYTSPRPDLSGTILPFFFITMSIVSARHVPLALLITLPHYAYVISNLHFPWHKQRVVMRCISPWFDAFKHRTHATRKLGNKEHIFSWLILIVLLPGVAAMHYATQGRLDTFDNWAVPDRAVTFIKENEITGNILNQYSKGGYLIFKLYPESKVFIDGRADLYGDKFFNIHQTIINARKGWRELISRYDIDYVLLPNDSPVLCPLNGSDEFKLVYRDEIYSVLVRNTEKFRIIIDKYGKYYELKK